MPHFNGKNIDIPSNVKKKTKMLKPKVPNDNNPDKSTITQFDVNKVVEKKKKLKEKDIFEKTKKS